VVISTHCFEQSPFFSSDPNLTEIVQSAATPWAADKDLPNSDSDGWSYDVDFGTFQNSSGKKQMVHFVRRRRLTRIQDFDINRLAGTHCDLKIVGSCDHCDTAEIEKLDAQMLLKLSDITLKLDQKVIPQPPVLNPLKTKLFDELLNPPSTGMQRVHAAIDTFQAGPQSSWGKMFTHTDKTAEDLPRRTELMASLHFEERSFVSKAIVRKHDLNYEFHCDKPNCGDACVFCPEACPNAGCTEVYSRKWASKHDSDCPQKVVPCPHPSNNNDPLE
jgi:hypothetical protein